MVGGYIPQFTGLELVWINISIVRCILGVSRLGGTREDAFRAPCARQDLQAQGSLLDS